MIDGTQRTGEAASNGPLQRAPGRVLPTLNEDGSRRWLEPKPAKGRFTKARRLLAFVLIGVFTAVPYLSMNGKPMILLDIVRGQFTLFGTTFLSSDTLLLHLLLLTLFLTIFLLTALFGRVWCGWACPQTVYLEFLFRPLERLFVGSQRAQHKRSPAARRLRRGALLVTWFAAAFYLAHTFLAYFVGVDALKAWVLGSPADHPVAFTVVAVTTVLMLGNFGWFREQTCVVVCPYGRFQSVLLDKSSLLVAYDAKRGEPRGKLKKRPEGQETHSLDPAAQGDCIDCRACVTTCPTGIDIRDGGLQMECVACAQCVDACDDIMDKIGRPRGLVRYTSKEELEGGKRTFLRWRTIVYPSLLAIAFTGLVLAIVMREPADVTVLRGLGQPYARTQTGEVTNQIRIKITNKGTAATRYQISLEDLPEARLIAPQNPLPVKPLELVETSVFVLLPETALPGGQRRVHFRIHGEDGFDKRVPYLIVGPAGGTSSVAGGRASR